MSPRQRRTTCSKLRATPRRVGLRWTWVGIVDATANRSATSAVSSSDRSSPMMSSSGGRVCAAIEASCGPMNGQPLHVVKATDKVTSREPIERGAHERAPAHTGRMNRRGRQAQLDGCRRVGFMSCAHEAPWCARLRSRCRQRASRLSAARQSLERAPVDARVHGRSRAVVCVELWRDARTHQPSARRELRRDRGDSRQTAARASHASVHAHRGPTLERCGLFPGSSIYSALAPMAGVTTGRFCCGSR